MMQIGELARRAGIQPSAVRYYESIGLLEPALRAGGRRVFDEDALERLAVIGFAKQLGFTLTEVRELFGGFRVSRWKPLAVRKLSELDAMTSRIQIMRSLLQKAVRCGCVDVQACGRALMKGCD
jgi:MerR family redox-sensitive transcriptional activator SoxR